MCQFIQSLCYYRGHWENQKYATNATILVENINVKDLFQTIFSYNTTKELKDNDQILWIISYTRAEDPACHHCPMQTIMLRSKLISYQNYLEYLHNIYGNESRQTIFKKIKVYLSENLILNIYKLSEHSTDKRFLYCANHKMSSKEIENDYNLMNANNFFVVALHFQELVTYQVDYYRSGSKIIGFSVIFVFMQPCIIFETFNNSLTSNDIKRIYFDVIQSVLRSQDFKYSHIKLCCYGIK